MMKLFMRPAITCFSAAPFLCACLATSTAALAVDAQSILKRTDEIRNPQKPFSISISLHEFKDGNKSDETTLAVYSKQEEKSGQYLNLVQYVLPARDKGKLLLKNGNDMWFYDAGSKASIRISPQQRLLGQASNGDVVSVNLAKDYSAKIEADEEIKDGDQKPRKSSKLALKATSADVTYNSIELWVDAESDAPIKAKFYSESGTLLKTAYYRKYENQIGENRPTETVIIDGLNPKWVTIMRYKDYQIKDIEDSWFQRDYLPRFKGE